MTEENAVAETKYRLAKCVFTTLFEKGLITESELNALLTEAIQKYQPMIGELEMESIAREKGYSGR